MLAGKLPYQDTPREGQFEPTVRRCKLATDRAANGREEYSRKGGEPPTLGHL